jgi:hypothetical protein
MFSMLVGISVVPGDNFFEEPDRSAANEMDAVARGIATTSNGTNER